MFTKDTGEYISESGRPRHGLVWELTMTELYSGNALREAWEWVETEDNFRALEYGVPSIFD